MIKINTFITAPLQTNTYVVSDGDVCWIVDPGDGPDEVVDFIITSGMTPKAILLTHGHGDHIAGVADMQKAFAGLKLLCPADDAFMLGDATANLSGPFGYNVTAPQADEMIQPEQTLELGDSSWKVLDTSGHTRGGVSFYCARSSVVIVGDALFANSIGRTDIPGASSDRLIDNIKNNLLTLPDETRVLPGHGPETTIGTEKQINPFVRM